MATVTGFTSERMLEIEESTVVDGEIQGDNLILMTRGGTPIDAGNVRGAQGAQGPVGVTHVIQDEGVIQPTQPALNFVGGGVVVNDDPANTRTIITVPAPVYPTPGHVIQNEGANVTPRNGLNFVGKGIDLVDDLANNRTNVVPIPPAVHVDCSNDTWESGDITNWISLWSYGFYATVNHWYQVQWVGSVVSRIANSAPQGASVRIMYDGPNEAAYQANMQDIYLPAAAVVMPFNISALVKAPSSGDALYNIQVSKAWWSSVAIRITRIPSQPQFIIVKDLGVYP